MALHIPFFSRKPRVGPRADEFERRISAIALSVAGRFARGNVALQRGYVVTREQLDAEREALKVAARR